jgi:transcriptional regulator with XRE-family HTH domain
MTLQHRKTKRAVAKTLGGEKLRNMRYAAGLSLVELAARLEIEHGKPIDAGHINKIETGTIKKPTAETLETILTGLQASYRERRDMLEAFGYRVPMTLPTEQEIAEARKLSAHELGDATYPVLLVDYGQRLWAWNRYMPRMIGLDPDDPATNGFTGVTLLDVTFNPALGTSSLIDNPDDFLPPVIHYIKASVYPAHEEAWYQTLISTARTFPGFSALWDSLPEAVFERFVYRNIIPLKVQLPRLGVLQFRMTTADFDFDPRFHIIHFTPYGATTLHVCAEWAAEEGVL